MGIGKRIKEARSALNLTQEELANIIGVTKGAIANYENETSHPKEPVMYKLIDALQVDANYLFQDVVNIPKKVNDVTLAEFEMVEKYRTLDEYGKDMVNTVLEKELYRTNQQKAVIYGDQPELADMVRELPLYYMPVSAGGGNYLDSTDYEFISVADVSYANKADFAVRISGDSMEPRFSTGDIILVQEQSAIDPGELGIFILNGDSLFKLFGGDRLISLNENYEDRLIGPDDSFYCKGKVLGAVRCVE